MRCLWGMKHVRLVSALAVLLAAGSASEARAGWTPFFSEETSPPLGQCQNSSQAVNGVICVGSYCDNMRLQCEPLPHGITTVNHNWEHEISDPDGYTVIFAPSDDYIASSEYLHVCDWGVGIVTGMFCDDDYCDNITIECATPRYNVGGTLVNAYPTDCYWSNPDHSEENPVFGGVSGSDEFITGVACYGSYCDRKRYRMCSFEPPPDSCESRCGEQTSSGCWCDSACTWWGDCCSDYTTHC